MADIAISNLNQIEEVAIGDVLAIDDISAGETKKIPFESLQGGVININPTFSIWQENTTFTNPGNGVHTADGYKVIKGNGGGTAPSINVKKNITDMEVGFEQCCELEITNVGVGGAGRYWRYSQLIEDYKEYRGKNTIVSIRIKSSVAVTIPGGRMQVNDGVSSKSIDITSITTDWVTYPITLSIADAASLLELRFYVVFFPGEISTTGSVYIQYMKFELGSVATPLIPRKTGEELALCQRYYQKSYVPGGFPGDATDLGTYIFYAPALANADHTMYVSLKLPIVMKAVPTVTLYDKVGNSGKITMAAGDNIPGGISKQSNSGFYVSGTNGAAATARHIEFHYTAVSRV